MIRPDELLHAGLAVLDRAAVYLDRALARKGSGMDANYELDILRQEAELSLKLIRESFRHF